MKKVFLLSVMTLFFLCNFYPVYSQWRRSPDHNTPVSTNSNAASSLGMISGNNGNVIMAWTKNLPVDGDDNDMYVQCFDAAGTPLWGENGKRIGLEPSKKLNLTLVTDDDNGAYVLWSEATSYSLCKVSNTGTLEWFKSSFSSVHNQHHVQITPDHAGGVIIAYQVDGRTDDHGVSIYAERYNKLGERLWGEIIIEQLKGERYLLDMQTDIAGNIFILDRGEIDYEDSPETIDDFDSLFVHKIDNAGGYLFPRQGILVALNIRLNEGNKIGYSLALDTRSNAFVAFYETPSGPAAEKTLFGQKITSAGTRAWGNQGVRISKFNTNGTFDLAADERGGAIYTWSCHDCDDGGDWDIKAQRINSSGTIVWGGGGKYICNEVNEQSFPAVVLSTYCESDNIDGAFIVWRDERSSSSGAVYTSKITLEGGTEFSNGYKISHTHIESGASRKDKEICMLSDGTGSALIAWLDGRDGVNVYADKTKRKNPCWLRWAPFGVNTFFIGISFVILAAGVGGYLIPKYIFRKRKKTDD